MIGIKYFFHKCGGFFDCFKQGHQEVSSGFSLVDKSEFDLPDILKCPDEIIGHIFSFCPPHQGESIRAVCRKFKEIGSSDLLWVRSDLKDDKYLDYLRTWYPKIQFIGPQIWNKYINCNSLEMDLSELPPIHRVDLLKSLSLYHRVEKNLGVTLLTLPKGLTFKKLNKIIESNRVPWPKSASSEPKLAADQMIQATSIQIVSNSILNKSRDLPKTQRKSFCKNFHCEEANDLTVRALSVLLYLESSDIPSDRKFLYEKLFAYAHSSEDINDSNVFVKQISPSGVCFYSHNFTRANVGIVAAGKV